MPATGQKLAGGVLSNYNFGVELFNFKVKILGFWAKLSHLLLNLKTFPFKRSELFQDLVSLAALLSGYACSRAVLSSGYAPTAPRAVCWHCHRARAKNPQLGNLFLWILRSARLSDTNQPPVARLGIFDSGSDCGIFS